jgi:hypothetical protein
MIKTKYFGLFFLVGASLAYANSPLPVSYVGLDTLYMGGGFESSGVACFGAGCGGEFSGTITGSNLNSPAVLANFWCVDSQEDFSWGDGGYADVVQLSDIATYSQYVRYTSVVNGTGPGPYWTDGSLPSSAVVRYEMAAWLVSQYPGVGSNPGNPVITNGTLADDTQEAIWDIMNNGSAGIDAPYSASNEVDPNGVNALIASALSNYPAFAASQGNDWAVVSWDSTSLDGTLTAPNHQTFLVDLVPGSPNPNTNYSSLPEPGFYGVLTLGLGGLIFAVRRRQKA